MQVINKKHNETGYLVLHKKTCICDNFDVSNARFFTITLKTRSKAS